MSEAATYLSCVLDTGKLLVAEAFVQNKKIKPYAFAIGDAYNFTPLESTTNVSGNLVYLGNEALIKGFITAKDTFKFNLTVPERAGDFSIGNIILYMKTEDNTVFPFILVALKIPYPKQAQRANSIGNRFVFEFIEKVVNANDVLQMTIVPSDYASLSSYGNEFDLPEPSQALFQQFFVQEPEFSPVPFVGARRAIDNSYWGTPLYSRLGDPFFGVLDGGRVGDKTNPMVRSFWGGGRNFKDLRITYGGGNINEPPVYNLGGGYIFD